MTKTEREELRRLIRGVRDWWYFAGQGHIGPWRVCPACQLGNLIAWLFFRGDCDNWYVRMAERRNARQRSA